MKTLVLFIVFLFSSTAVGQQQVQKPQRLEEKITRLEDGLKSIVQTLNSIESSLRSLYDKEEQKASARAAIIQWDKPGLYVIRVEEDGSLTQVDVNILNLSSTPNTPDDPSDPDDPPDLNTFQTAVKAATDKVSDGKKSEIATLLKAIIQQDFNSAETLIGAANGLMSVLASESEWVQWRTEIDAAIEDANYTTVSQVKAAYTEVAKILEN